MYFCLRSVFVHTHLSNQVKPFVPYRVIFQKLGDAETITSSCFSIFHAGIHAMRFGDVASISTSSSSILDGGVYRHKLGDGGDGIDGVSSTETDDENILYLVSKLWYVYNTQEVILPQRKTTKTDLSTRMFLAHFIVFKERWSTVFNFKRNPALLKKKRVFNCT